MDASTSFASRRPAAGGLPAFSLPPPEIPSTQRYPAPASASSPFAPAPNSSFLPSSISSSPSPALFSASLPAPLPVPVLPTAISNRILTPPSGVTSDGLSPLSSSGVNTGSSQSSQPGIYYPQHGQWPTPGGNSSYTFSSSNAQVGQNSYNTGRSMYSPSMQYPGRSSQSPATAGELPPPPHGQDLPPFSTPLSASGSGYGNLASQHPNSILGGQNPSSQPPTPVTTAPDSYRQPPTPSYPYSASSTPQQPSFPAYSQPSPTQPSPTTSGGGSRGLSSMAPQQGSGMAPPLGYGSARPPPPHAYPYHSLPNVPGPVMSNIGNPGGQMALVPGVGGMSMPPGYGPHTGHHLPHMYGQQANQQDRPFKCDICPQSFNRNHDLKRHKRIHLAVKPFPCTFCDKSFSRKDALKVSDIFKL